MLLDFIPSCQKFTGRSPRWIMEDGMGGSSDDKDAAMSSGLTTLNSGNFRIRGNNALHKYTLGHFSPKRASFVAVC